MAGLFNTLTASVMAGVTKDTSKKQVMVSMGGAVLPFAMADISSGDQRSRLQLDMALDGTIHVTGSLDGAGSFRMQFMDCPLYITEGDSTTPGALAKFLEAQAISDRIIEVTLYSVSAVCKQGEAQQQQQQQQQQKKEIPVARFTGVAEEALVTVSPPDRNNVILLRTQINATGRWYR